MNNQKKAQILKSKNPKIQRIQPIRTAVTPGNNTSRDMSPDQTFCQSKEQYCQLLRDSSFQNMPLTPSQLIQMEQQHSIAKNQPEKLLKQQSRVNAKKCQLCELVSKNLTQNEGSSGQTVNILPYVNNKLYIKMLLSKSKKNKKSIRLEVKEKMQPALTEAQHCKSQVKPPLPQVKNQKLQCITVQKSRNNDEHDQSVSSLQNLKGPNKFLSRLIVKKRNLSQPILDQLEIDKSNDKVTKTLNHLHKEQKSFTQTVTPRSKLLLMIKNNSQEHSNFTQSPSSSNRDLWRLGIETDDHEIIEPLCIKLGMMENNELENFNPQYSKTYDSRTFDHRFIGAQTLTNINEEQEQTFRPFQQKISVISNYEEEIRDDNSNFQSLIQSQTGVKDSPTTHHHVSIELEDVDQMDEEDEEEEKDQVSFSHYNSFMNTSPDQSRIMGSIKGSAIQSKSPNIIGFKIKPTLLKSQTKQFSFKSKQFFTIDHSFTSDLQNQDVVPHKPVEKVIPLFPDIAPKKAGILETINKMNLSKRFTETLIKNQKKTLSLKSIKFTQEHQQQESLSKRIGNLGVK